ncbi:helix-turn-helix domain-containing protein [Puteibacter caeruleilacunae]|nr:helix-turn-helix domain-containing protein [Puteibacter caeruleilacunae]
METPCYALDNYFDDGRPCLSFNVEDINHTPPYKIDEVHQYNHYKIFLFDEGESRHTIDFEDYNFKKASVSVIFPRQFQKVQEMNDVKGSVIMFNEELFCSEILRKELRAYCIDLKMRLNHLELTAEQYQEINGVALMIKSLFADLNAMRKEQIRHLIKVMLLRLMDFSKSKDLDKKETSESNIYLEFTEKVDNDFKEIRLVSEYADQLGVSTKKLNALSKKYGGQTALQVIHERIYMEARRLLAFSGMTHKEIAYELKFDSPSAFNKFIQSKVGCTPTELQDRLTQIYNSKD